MSDTPERKPTVQELTLGFAQVAKEQNVDVLVVACSENTADSKFERIGYVDGDAAKLIYTLAGFVRSKLPEHMQQRLLNLLTSPEPAVTEVGPQTTTGSISTEPKVGKDWVH